MHPLLAEDFAKIIIEERLVAARKSARVPRRRRLRPALGRLLVSLGSRLAA
jgi:hypothetical protein